MSGYERMLQIKQKTPPLLVGLTHAEEGFTAWSSIVSLYRDAPLWVRVGA